MSHRITTGEARREVARLNGEPPVPDWRMRRTLDALAIAGKITLERIGQYRTISDADVPTVADELKQLRCIAEAVNV